MLVQASNINLFILMGQKHIHIINKKLTEFKMSEEIQAVLGKISLLVILLMLYHSDSKALFTVSIA